MKCPKCKKNIKLAEQIKDWDEAYGEDVVLDGSFPAMINIFCENCEKPTCMVFIEGEGYELSKEENEAVMEKIDKYETEHGAN